MRKNTGHTVPDGYFEGLRGKLSEIPEQKRESCRIQKACPYLALVGCFLMVALIGRFVLCKTAKPSASTEEIAEFVINSGVTLVQLEEFIISNY